MYEGLFLLLPSDAKARDYFDQLFAGTLWDLWVVETNRYAQQKDKPFEVTSIADMKAFVGLTVAMSIRKLPRISNYWSSYWVLRVSHFTQLCTKNRFMSLWYNIHLVDNTSKCTTVCTSVYQESIHVIVVQYTCSVYCVPRVHNTTSIPRDHPAHNRLQTLFDW